MESRVSRVLQEVKDPKDLKDLRAREETKESKVNQERVSLETEEKPLVTLVQQFFFRILYRTENSRKKGKCHFKLMNFKCLQASQHHSRTCQ